MHPALFAHHVLLIFQLFCIYPALTRSTAMGAQLQIIQHIIAQHAQAIVPMPIPSIMNAIQMSAHASQVQ